MIILSQLDHHRNWNLAQTTFIPRVDLPVAAEKIRNLLLSFVMVNPKLLDSFVNYPFHLSTILTHNTKTCSKRYRLIP